MNASIMTDEQILELGFEALVNKLGPIGMIRFIHQFEAGVGNFTEDRQQWVGVSDVETLAKQIQHAEENIEYAINAFSPVIEQKPDEAYSSLAKTPSDLQESEGTRSDLAVEDIEMGGTPLFRLESRIQGFASSVSS